MVRLCVLFATALESYPVNVAFIVLLVYDTAADGSIVISPTATSTITAIIILFVRFVMSITLRYPVIQSRYAPSEKRISKSNIILLVLHVSPIMQARCKKSLEQPSATQHHFRKKATQRVNGTVCAIYSPGLVRTIASVSTPEHLQFASFARKPRCQSHGKPPRDSVAAIPIIPDRHQCSSVDS